MLFGAALTITGMVVVALSLHRTDTAVTEVGESPLTRSLMVMFGGGVLFAVGIMTFLAGMVRPMFERRPIDDVVNRLK
jgi:hypothetical protein